MLARDLFEEAAQVPAADLLKIGVETAHILINTGAKSLQFPGSTCVILHLAMSQATWTSIGDSRLYRFRDGQFLDRTVDHTDVDLARLEGSLSEEEARADPRRNRLFGYLGGLRWPQIEVKSANSFRVRQFPAVQRWTLGKRGHAGARGRIRRQKTLPRAARTRIRGPIPGWGQVRQHFGGGGSAGAISAVDGLLEREGLPKN